MRTGLAAVAASVAVLLGAVVSPASAADRPEPPTTAAIERATERLLAKPGFESLRPQRLLAPRNGGVGAGPDRGPRKRKRVLLPRRRFVTLYGAPQLGATALGKRSARGAQRRIVKQARPYRRLGDRKVTAGFNLIGTIATADPGPDGKYRMRQPDQVIAKYLRRARSFGGRLVLDIQPGRASVLSEIRALRPWIAQPDVDVAVDPEWDVGKRGVPGRTEGSIRAEELNRVSARIQRIIEREDLPPKLLVVHQFRRGSVRLRRQVDQQRNVSVLLNFDGIGAPEPKRAGYEDLSVANLFNGFSIFYDLDTRVMKPREVLDLRPTVDFLLYQ